MSNPHEKHPGKGFIYIPGYEPPAGTIASEEKRKEEAEKRRQKEENDERWRALAREQRLKQEEADKRRKAQQAAERRKESAKKRSFKPESKPENKSGWGVVILIVIVVAAAGKKDGVDNNANQNPRDEKTETTHVVDRNKKAINSDTNEGKPFNNGIFLSQEKMENYWNDWWGRKLTSSRNGINSDKVEITIQGGGKTVDFIGTLTINCSNGSYSWSGVQNFRYTISEKQAKSIVPKRVIDNAIKFFCSGR